MAETGSLLWLANRGLLHPDVAADLRTSAERRGMANAARYRRRLREVIARPPERRLGLTATAEGVDFSYTPTGAFGCMRASGRTFVCMYIKWAGRGAFEAARAAGLRPVAIYETTGTDYRGGRGAGQYAAHAFEAWCGANGYPGAPVYFTYDEDVLGYGRGGAAHDYALGWRDVIGLPRCGAYAQNGLVGQLLDAGLIARQWVTYAWSGGGLDPRVTLYQNPNGVGVCGVDCDRDRAFQASIGAVGEGIGPPPPPGPPPHREDHDMYRLLAPGDPPATMPLPIFAKGAAILTSDAGGINATNGVPVRAAIRNETGSWIPLLGAKPDDPRLGSDPYVAWFPGGDRWINLDGSGGLLVVENLSEARKAALGVAPDAFPAGNELGLCVTW